MAIAVLIFCYQDNKCYLFGNLQTALGLHIRGCGREGTLEGGAQTLHGGRRDELRARTSCREAAAAAPPPPPAAAAARTPPDKTTTYNNTTQC